MSKWKCIKCGYIHDGIIDDSFKCPKCTGLANQFVKFNYFEHIKNLKDWENATREALKDKELLIEPCMQTRKEIDKASGGMSMQRGSQNRQNNQRPQRDVFNMGYPGGVVNQPQQPMNQPMNNFNQNFNNQRNNGFSMPQPTTNVNKQVSLKDLYNEAMSEYRQRNQSF